MKIDSETYETIRGDILTRHCLVLGDHRHVLDTRELWQLTLLAVVRLGECLKESRVPIGGKDDLNS